MDPFSFHWYEGEEPRLVPEAVKFTVVPAQTVLPCDELIEAVGAAVEFTVITILLLTAIAGLEHGKLLVISQVTTSPLTNVLVV